MTMRKLDVPHTPVELTEQQRANLIKLRDYVAEKVDPQAFDMSAYCVDESGEDVDLRNHQCGTAACYMGWGPRAGINPEQFVVWDFYSKKFVSHPSSCEWRFLFSQNWPNSIPEAIARTDYLLEHGLPGFTYRTQFAPLRETQS